MNILQVCSKPAYPPIDGASIAMFNLHRGLKDNGCVVHLIAMNTYKQYCDISTVPDEFVKNSNYTLIEVDIRVKVIPAFFNLFTNQSYNIIRFDSDRFRYALTQKLIENDYDVVILESLYATPYIESIRQKTNATIVLRSHNVEHKIWENLELKETNIFKRWYLKLLAKRLKSYELTTLSKVDLIASISNEDNLIFNSESCQTPKVYLPFGINFNDDEFKDYTQPDLEHLQLFHLGSMDWIPHQEAFKWFFDKVWPALNKNNSKIELHLAGSNMPAWISNGNYPNLFVNNGYVDGKSFMKNKDIMVVPSFYGSGIRIKIVEGMAKGKIIITTANGAMGIPCTNYDNILISDDCEEWIDLISKCFTDSELVKSVSYNARIFSQREYDYKRAAGILLNALRNGI